MKFPRSTLSALTGALCVAGAAWALPAMAAQEVTLYTTREPKLIQPLLDAYTKESGVKVNTVFVKDGLLERVKAEGDKSPADVLMTVDIGNLLDLVDGGVTQAAPSKTLESVVPANLRGANGAWYALSLRDRVLYVEKQLPLQSFHYEDLADPKWKGKVCIRSGQHPYNTGLIAAMIAHDGTEATEKWLRGVKANLARKAAGGDRDVRHSGRHLRYRAGQCLLRRPDEERRSRHRRAQMGRCDQGRAPHLRQGQGRRHACEHQRRRRGPPRAAQGRSRKTAGIPGVGPRPNHVCAGQL
jgi:hypothetical protein